MREGKGELSVRSPRTSVSLDSHPVSFGSSSLSEHWDLMSVIIMPLGQRS